MDWAGKNCIPWVKLHLDDNQQHAKNQKNIPPKHDAARVLGFRFGFWVLGFGFLGFWGLGLGAWGGELSFLNGVQSKRGAHSIIVWLMTRNLVISRRVIINVSSLRGDILSEQIQHDIIIE